MRDLLLFALAGFAATFVDGALGMGFGPTSSSILLGSGLAPAAASTHQYREGRDRRRLRDRPLAIRNIDQGLVLALAVPGCIGAVLGVTVLASVDGTTLRPYLAMLLTLVGLRILIRLIRPPMGDRSSEQPTARALSEGSN